MADTEFDDELDELSGASTSDGELFEHFRFVADKGQQLLRVDKFLVRDRKSTRLNSSHLA